MTTAVSMPSVSSVSSKPYRPNVYDESIFQIYVADVVYLFANLIDEMRKPEFGSLTGGLTYPDCFRNKKEYFEQFRDHNCVLRNFQGNDGMSLYQITELIYKNKNKFSESMQKSPTMKRLDEYWKKFNDDKNDDPDYCAEHSDSDYCAKDIFLEYFRSKHKDVSCVYGIFKDTKKKKITVVFRGSVSGKSMDWPTNFNVFHTEMRTPELAQEKMKGSAKEHVLVHKGLYEYLLDNELLEAESKEQRYYKALEDIKSLIGKDNPHGYKVYIAGHSLGASLAILMAFKLAGTTDPCIPKPITCITIEGLRVGTTSFRDAFTELEKKGLLRCLRIINTRDIVPVVSPITFGGLYWSKFFPKLYKHAGINVRFNADKYSIIHPEGLGFWSSITNALENSMTKLIWVLHSILFHGGLKNATEYHTREMCIKRLEMHKSELKEKHIDALYIDPEIVGPDFVYKGSKHNFEDSELVDDKTKKN